MATPTLLQIPPTPAGSGHEHPLKAQHRNPLDLHVRLQILASHNFGPKILSPPQFKNTHAIGILVHTNPPKSISRKVDYTQIVESPNSHFHTIGYSPCFVSHYNVSKGEEVKRVKGSKIPDKLFAEVSYDCAGSGMPPLKTTKLNFGYGSPALKEGLPRSS